MLCKRGRSTARKKEKTKAEMEADMEKTVVSGFLRTFVSDGLLFLR